MIVYIPKDQSELKGYCDRSPLSSPCPACDLSNGRHLIDCEVGVRQKVLAAMMEPNFGLADDGFNFSCGTSDPWAAMRDASKLVFATLPDTAEEVYMHLSARACEIFSDNYNPVAVFFRNVSEGCRDYKERKNSYGW